jgi:hypothetical protein
MSASLGDFRQSTYHGRSAQKRGLVRSILGAGSFMLRTFGFYFVIRSGLILERLAMTAIAYLAGPDVFLPAETGRQNNRLMTEGQMDHERII